MNAIISDPNALRAVTPMALSTYARTSGWARVEPYGDHSDVYAGPSLPEIILPRTRQLGDYALVVARLVEIFARTAEVSEATLYNILVIADRDAIREQASDGTEDNSIDINRGATMVNGARAIALAATCSLRSPRAIYRTGSNREANEFLSQMRLGQTERGSFVVTLLTPVIPPLIQHTLFDDPETDDAAPLARQVTRRLEQALTATRYAVEMTSAGDADAFSNAVAAGVSANLCEALAELTEPFDALNISITWARTRPMTTARRVVRFTNDDAPILRAAAQSFRNREPQPDVQLFGSVRVLRRDESERDGTVTIRAPVNGSLHSVTATLTQSDYDLAIRAHRERTPVIAEGDLERIGTRWHLHNPRIVTVISAANDDPAEVEQ